MLRNSAQDVSQANESGYQRFQLGRIPNSVAVRCLTHLSTVINRACQPRASNLSSAVLHSSTHQHHLTTDRENEIALFYREKADCC